MGKRGASFEKSSDITRSNTAKIGFRIMRVVKSFEQTTRRFALRGAILGATPCSRLPSFSLASRGTADGVPTFLAKRGETRSVFFFFSFFVHSATMSDDD